jgi:putative SOS response-associated peptidase YedK
MSASRGPVYEAQCVRAMPVILTSTEAVDQWLTLPVKEALALQRPLPDGALRVVATGEKEDGLAA